MNIKSKKKLLKCIHLVLLPYDFFSLLEFYIKNIVTKSIFYTIVFLKNIISTVYTVPSSDVVEFYEVFMLISPLTFILFSYIFLLTVIQ